MGGAIAIRLGEVPFILRREVVSIVIECGRRGVKGRFNILFLKPKGGLL
jgi:hypothetical protein